ncbi:MAG: Motility protein B [Elusimicrobia bacterium ADurb.Bin231]|nr:MAG: Motility protein B [Elusimicrobia bacterium ADurb.Bin231]
MDNEYENIDFYGYSQENGQTSHKSKKKFSTDKNKDIVKKSLIAEDAWVIPYGNLMTILMIFFMILYAYSIIYGGAKYEKTMAMIQKTMGGSDEQIKQSEKMELEAIASEKMENLIKDKHLEKYAKVEIDANRVKISLSNPVLFDSGRAELKKEALPTLKEVAKIIATLDAPVIIEGHTDNIPILSKKYRSNFELSAARAFGVINYFINSENISPERFSALGYGEYRPIASNETEEERAKNRRIEISIIRKS